MDDTLKYIILILVGVGIFWVILGGPSRMADRQGLFIKPPSPIDTGETYGQVSFWDNFKITKKETAPATEELSEKEKMAVELEQIKEETEKIQVTLDAIKKEQNISLFVDKVEISRCYGNRSDVNEEYIRLKIKNLEDDKTQISDWKLRSAMTGAEIKIGNAVKLPYTSRTNTENAIFISNGDEIILTSGRSPIGFSFLVNKCSGYLEQFQDFEPNLTKKCPLAEDEEISAFGPNAFNDACFDFMDKISRCETPLKFPIDMQPECQNYLITNLNHNACIDNHKNDTDFLGNEWRIFLNREDELWKNKREIIELIDNQGKLVDVCSY
ncbi:MAG: hypothetical protein ABIG87_02100 [Patescibacteria group bacterium]